MEMVIRQLERKNLIVKTGVVADSPLVRSESITGQSAWTKTGANQRKEERTELPGNAALKKALKSNRNAEFA
jgi:hypothetical protein